MHESNIESYEKTYGFSQQTMAIESSQPSLEIPVESIQSSQDIIEEIPIQPPVAVDLDPSSQSTVNTTTTSSSNLNSILDARLSELMQTYRRQESEDAIDVHMHMSDSQEFTDNFSSSPGLSQK